MKLRDAVIQTERFFERMLGAYEKGPTSTTDPDLLTLSDKYKLQIITDYSADEQTFSFSALDKAQLKNARDLLETELDLYTPQAIHDSRLERIVLCSDLKGGEDTVSGLADMGFLIVDTIFINIDRVKKFWEHAQRTVHHELFHCMDFFDDGLIDFEWRKLNQPGFTYWHLNNLTVKETHKGGFLQDYCMKSEWEDKAVVYSYLIVNHAEVLRRCEKDKILAEKVERLKEIVLKISPEFDDQFWERINQRSLKHSREFSIPGHV